MSNIIKEQILSMLHGLNKVEEIQLAGLPESVFVRHFTIAEQAKLAELHKQNEKDASIATVAMIRLGLSDKDGNRIFDDSKDDTAKILALPARVSGLLLQEISRVNFGDDVDTAEKN